MKMWNMEHASGSETILHDAILENTLQYTLAISLRRRAVAHANYEFWLIIIYQYWLYYYNIKICGNFQYI